MREAAGSSQLIHPYFSLMLVAVTIQFAVVKDILVFHHGRRDTRRVVEK